MFGEQSVVVTTHTYELPQVDVFNTRGEAENYMRNEANRIVEKLKKDKYYHDVVKTETTTGWRITYKSTSLDYYIELSVAGWYSVHDN